jgi:hypothetical protein
MTTVPIIQSWRLATWSFLIPKNEVEQNEVSQHESTSSCICSSNTTMTTQSLHGFGNVLLFFKGGLLSASQFAAFSTSDVNQQKVTAVKN